MTQPPVRPKPRAAGSSSRFALVILAGELDVDPHLRLPFRGLLFEELYADPTTGLSLALFAVTAALVWERIGPAAAATTGSHNAGSWIALTALLVVLGGAKASALPVLLGGLGWLIGWRIVRERRVRREELYVAGLASAVLAGLFLTLYAGPRVGTELRLGAGLRQMSTVEQLLSTHPGVPSLLFWVMAAPAALVALFGPIMGGMLLLANRRCRPPAPAGAFLGGLALAGVIPFLLVSIASGNEVYFTVYALLAGALAAALGFRAMWETVRARASISARTLLWIYASLLALALLLGLARADTSAGIDRFALTTAIAAGLVALAAVVAWSATRSGSVAALIAAGGLAVVGSTDTPLDVLPPVVDAWQGTPAHLESGRGLTPAVLEGLRWVRGHSSKQAILAVNNHYANEEGTDPRAFLYSAFSERRILIQSWLYTERAHKLGLARVADGLLPYPELTRLNDRAFSGDAAAAADLACRGVDWLVLDRRYAPRTVPPELEPAAYENADLAVYRLPRGSDCSGADDVGRT